MNPTELRLMKRLVETGRLSPESLHLVFEEQPDGRGLVDTLILHDAVSTRDVELLLAELSDEDESAGEDDPFIKSVQRLDRYVVLSTLGRGGIGRVYLAYDTKLKRSVALKAMRIERAQDLQRFRREVEIASSLQHPNIAAVYDTESVDDIFVIAMQYVDGLPLDSLRLSPREAMEAGAQAARALQAAHDRGIIHRDLKPGNLMRAKDGRLYLLDFGIARPAGEAGTVTQSGGLIGTPSYMSPEQAQGRPLDARTDIYSLGATLYSLVTQHVPFDGSTPLEIVRRVASETPPRPRRLDPGLDREIEFVILKAMSHEPSLRYASARDLAEDIGRFLAGEPVRARPLSIPARTVRYLRRRPWAMATLTAVLLGLVACVGILLSQQARQARLSEARGLIERAGRAIDEYDRLILLPPQD
ncbi:MAG TPA: protein kinase, partial [Planctomycetota bacterium]|nr:protein kinase [Planctomycetota bacterium]